LGVTLTAHDATLPGLELEQLVTSSDVEYGEVFTQPWIVNLILDLCRYHPDEDLTTQVLVEPSAGGGAFLAAAVDRLIEAKAKYAPELDWERLDKAIFAIDMQPGHVRTCRSLVVKRLQRAGCPAPTAEELAKTWVKLGDFLLYDHAGRQADVVVGNPPYIRIEDIPPPLLKAYRRACPTMGGRADVYVGFYERGLDLLKPDGRLGYICADRWMRNQYGHRLRAKIVNGFAMDACLIMHDAPAFEEKVSAYPAITVLRRGPQQTVATGEADEKFNTDTAQKFVAWAADTANLSGDDNPLRVARLPHWHTTSDSWPDGSPETLAWLEELADRLPLLEDDETETRIGIGVATGADKVYVTKDSDAAEPERMLPLAMSADVKSGQYQWTGHYLVNPWTEDGLVDLASWPRLAAYLHRHAAAITGRAIAKRGAKWYRTIDRVTLSLTNRPKLLLEDMKARPNPVLEPGGRYPHHNLYYLVSNGWDLEVLGGLLLSEVVERQISAYCVKMRGKTLRFQAQYLRRVRAPHPHTISEQVSRNLAQAFRQRDRDAATTAALQAYSMTSLPR
jgi:adenine-specific DNA-methyltransferase